MVKPDQVANGIVAFVDGELLPSMDGWQKFAAAAAVALARQRADVLLAGLAGNRMVTALGLVDADGMVDVDAAVDALKQAARTQGKLALDIPGMGQIKLGEDDFDALKGYITRAGA